MKNRVDRMVEEHAELAIRLGKLNSFLHSEHISLLADEDTALLEIQYSCMEGYFKVLVRRLEREGYYKDEK